MLNYAHFRASFFMILQYFASKICILGGTAIENIIVAHELGFEHQVPGLSLATSLHLLSFSLSLSEFAAAF